MGKAIIDKYFPTDPWEEVFFVSTGEQKAISDYTGLNILEVENLPYGRYLLYRRDTWINNLRQTEEGREILQNIWRLTQTKADYNAIRNKMKGV